jgi:hypothetical protein
MDIAFKIPVRLKLILEKRNENGPDTTSLALFKEMHKSASSYCRAKPGQAWATELSNWCEPYRTHIETCITYLICRKDQYWNDSYEDLYEHIERILYIHTTRRKLALLIA